MKMNLTKERGFIKGMQQTYSIANFPKYPAPYREFVTDTMAIAESNGIKIRCDRNALVYTGEEEKIGFEGFFSTQSREIVISTRDTHITSWMTLLVHESSHMD